ncbi:MAG: hypothetical protein EOO22_28385, partial [Comamonadaceae bacterium]
AVDSSAAVVVGLNTAVIGSPDTVAVGRGANASQATQSVAIGSGATLTGTGYSVAIGANATAFNAGTAIAIGKDAAASGLPAEDGSSSGDQIAIGTGSQGFGENGMAIGTRATTTKSNALAIGIDAKADHANSVAIGSGSVSAIAADSGSVTLRGNTYQFAGPASATTNTLSVGAPGSERQIKNVAAGVLSTTSTDAVNGSQLYATNQALEGVQGTVGNAVFYNDASKTSITLNPAGTATTIDNLAPGTLSPTSTQAVNGSQLNTTNQSVTNLGNTVNNIDLTGTKYFKANSTLPGAQANGTDSVAIGPNSVAGGSNSVALGNGAQASQNNSVA